MALKLRPTGLGSGIDKDRQDFTIYNGGWGCRPYTPLWITLNPARDF
jgi:hypothetical protein